MAWSTAEDGFGKARIKQIQQLMQSVIPSLQECFSLDPNLSFLTNSRIPLDATSVVRGDFDQMWDINKGGYLRIYVSSGAHHMRGPSPDESQTRFYIAGGATPGGVQRHFSTTLSVIFHEAAFNLYDSDHRATAREDAFQTILDWLDWDLFGLSTNRKLLIPSHCHSNLVTADNPEGFDFMYDVKIGQSAKIMVLLGSGNKMLGVQAIVTGWC